MSNSQELYNALAVLDSIGDFQELNRRLCEMTPEQMHTYREQLDAFKNCHQEGSKVSDYEKGKILEKLVYLLLQFSGGLFSVKQNVATNTNEIDIVCELTPKGQILLSRNLLPIKQNAFLGECKNYKRAVDVTYVGKFACLMLTTAYQLGILFSYHGVTGRKWDNAQGLIRKFYLSRERIDDRYSIIAFSVDDFEAICNGITFLDIIKRKMEMLRLDTDYLSKLTHHPLENDILHYSPKGRMPLN